jgi:L-alanine-DL-glutamate epimerase-like enolase superfamily enzyme
MEEERVKIVRAGAYLVDLEPEVVRTDAIQEFVRQGTIFIALETDDGGVGTGYSYPIGTGGGRCWRSCAKTSCTG